MDQIIDEFDWYSERTPNEKCRVSVRYSRSIHKVYVEAYADDVLKHKGITFRADELPKIIEALCKAQQAIDR
jgi:hypothetical protein